MIIVQEQADGDYVIFPQVMSEANLKQSLILLK
jgi:hypothetical protein